MQASPVLQSALDAQVKGSDIAEDEEMGLQRKQGPTLIVEHVAFASEQNSLPATAQALLVQKAEEEEYPMMPILDAE